MNRDDVRFNIYYNEYVEKYLCTFWGRVDKLIIFLQIFLSTMVFSGISGTAAYGAIMTFMAVFSVVYTPGKRCYDADNQIMKYVQLRTHEKDLSDEELRNGLLKANKTDSDPLGAFQAGAYLRAAIRLNLETKDIKPLTAFESTMAWIGGDLPRA